MKEPPLYRCSDGLSYDPTNPETQTRWGTKSSPPILFDSREAELAALKRKRQRKEEDQPNTEEQEKANGKKKKNSPRMMPAPFFLLFFLLSICIPVQ